MPAVPTIRRTNARGGESALIASRAVFDRHLSGWCGDLLRLRCARLDRPRAGRSRAGSGPLLRWPRGAVPSDRPA